jgi:TonB family protein
VVELPKPDGYLIVRTSTAFLEVTGTDFIVESRNGNDIGKRETLVWCIEGSGVVRSSNRRIYDSATLRAEEFTTVLEGMRPADATSASTSSLQAQIESMNPQIAQSSNEPPTPPTDPCAGDFGGVPGESYAVGNGVSAPIPVYKPDPEYTKEARKAKIQGTVVLRIVVDTSGAVTDCKVVEPLDDGLDEMACEAAKTWRFKPALRNGTPVPVRLYVETSFRLF